MAEKTFDLELRVTTFGSIITWKVLLEDSTNDSQIVLGWLPSPDGYLYKKLPGYKINDHALEVFASCHGIKGGTITCVVLIDGEEREKSVVANVEDNKYCFVSYEI